MDGSYSLVTNGIDNTAVLPGSFVLMRCNGSLVNVGGPLNVTCVGNTWTMFPSCMSNTGGGGGVITTITTTTMAPSNGAPCTVDMSSTVIIANGYISNMGLTFTTITAATGNHIIIIYFCSYYMFHILGSLQFACGAGYTLDPTIGATYSCINGNWSPKPQCISKLLHFADIHIFIWFNFIQRLVDVHMRH
jgi:hypothetical protein